MITAIIASLVTIVLMYGIVKYFDRLRKKDLAEAERHKKEMIDYLLDDFEKKIS